MALIYRMIGGLIFFAAMISAARSDSSDPDLIYRLGSTV